MPTKYLKTAILVVCLTISSYILTNLIFVPIRDQNYFGFDLWYSLKVISMMVLVLYSFSLTIGIWGDWKQYLLVALPPILATAPTMLAINPFYGIVTGILLYMLLCFDLSRSEQLNKLLIKFKPYFIMRLSTNGLLFVFSVMGGLMVILSSSNLPRVDIGKRISEVAQPYVKNMINSELERQLQSQTLFLDSQEAAFSPELRAILDEKTTPLPSATAGIMQSLNLSSFMEKQINKFVEPYKNLLHPILAVLMFLLFQFYAAIASAIYFVTIDFVFLLARKTKFLKVENQTVSKEVLKF